jgi:hypothetical protein
MELLKIYESNFFEVLGTFCEVSMNFFSSYSRFSVIQFNFFM